MDMITPDYANEFKRLKSVLLYKPTNSQVFRVKSTSDALFVKEPQYNKIVDEINAYKVLLKSIGIEVYEFENLSDPNAIYPKDLIIAGKNKIALCNPKYSIRYPEKYVLREYLKRHTSAEIFTLEKHDIFFEGADFFSCLK